MYRFIFCFLLSLIWIPADAALLRDEPYPQETVTQLSLPQEIQGSVSQVMLDSQNQIWILTPAQFAVSTGGQVRDIGARQKMTIRPGMRMASAGQGNFIALAGAEGVYRYTQGGAAQYLAFEFGPVAAVAVSPRGEVWVGGEKGLFSLARSEERVQKVSEVSEPVTALACDNAGVVAVGTAKAFYRRDNGRWRREFIPSLIDGPVTALSADAAGNIWIGTEHSLNVQFTDKTFARFSGLEGLPALPVTALAAGGENDVWIATPQGLAHFRDGDWNAYLGPRWIRGEKVLSVDAGPNEVLIGTEKGISLLRLEPWSLAQKEQHYSAMVYPHHDRYGLVADIALKEMGSPDTYVQHDTDNDGLWTSIYLASLCFEYAVTQNEEVRQKAWHHFEAMEKLESITGVPGFFARTYVKKGEPHETGGEWHDSADGQWVWKADTSSDELCGHMFVYPLFYDFVARTDEEKQRVRSLVSRIMNYVVDNGYYLNDLDGKPTLWGVWAPEKLNDDPEWTVERGLNSLQMLSFLVCAHHITGERKFNDAFHALIKQHGYLENAINQKIEMPAELNHSDDELAFLPYYGLFRYTGDAALKAGFQVGIDRSWRIERPEKSSLWNVIYGTTGMEEFGLEDAVECLRQWPLDLINWPVKNSQRLDVLTDLQAGRHGEPQALEALPPDERPLMRWNGNPFRLDGGSGHDRDDPGAWLLPYWMARYHGFIE